MGSTKRAYLALGSNLGHRHATLQKAIFQLQKRAGRVVAVSAVYENPAVGFMGGDFLNIGLALDTQLSPMSLLRILMQIEEVLGRERSTQLGYQSRTLDIDLIFYEQEVIYTPELVLPHPRMHERNFVLTPLADIAPRGYHPLLHKEVRHLLAQCSDQSRLTKRALRLFCDRAAFFAQVRNVAIEGVIGVGKTTLVQKMAEDLGAGLVLERATENSLLPRFYQDPSRYAFPLEVSFLAERYQQFVEEVSRHSLATSFTVRDYDISKSLVFAKSTLPAQAFELYQKVFEVMYSGVEKPGLYVYLSQHTERLLENIKKRGRTYEQNVSASYLEKLHAGYMEGIERYFGQNSVVIDVSGLDFVHRPSDYETILEHLEDCILAL